MKHIGSMSTLSNSSTSGRRPAETIRKGSAASGINRTLSIITCEKPSGPAPFGVALCNGLFEAFASLRSLTVFQSSAIPALACTLRLIYYPQYLHSGDFYCQKIGAINMRMTRAALRAQAQADEYPEIERSFKIDHELQSQASLITPVYENPLDIKPEGKPETDVSNTYMNTPPVREALRDITYENYPDADGVVEVQLTSPTKSDHQNQVEGGDHRKSTRKLKAKAKGRTTKKAEAPIIVESEEEGQIEEFHERDLTEPEPSDDIVVEGSQEDQQISCQTRGPQGSFSSITENQPYPPEDCLSGPGPAVEEESPEISISSLSKTPKFDPEVHLPNDETSTSEDSFVRSITSRSPAKLALSQNEQSEHVDASRSILETHTPLRRVSSTNFEESFEAMDSLEDTIERLTAGLPTLQPQEIHSPESPIKSDRKSLKLQGTVSPNTSVARRPSPNKLFSVLRNQEKDKENTPPVFGTPRSKQKTPVKPKTPLVKNAATPLKPKTPAARQSSPLKPVAPSVRKPLTTSPTKPKVVEKKAASSSVADKSPRKSVMVANTVVKQDAPVRKPAVPLQLRPSQKQITPSGGSLKLEPIPKRVNIATQADKRSHQASMSFSNSPAKQQPNVHKRRVTSGGILSTSKPGFVPAKSSKVPTTSTFALPGDAVAEKLKAQREAREEKLTQPKVTIAEQKAAKLKAEREAREERVRINQIRAKETAAEKEKEKDKAKEKSKAPRPLNTAALSVSKARADAAERSRQASKEWAGKMLKKRQTEAQTKVDESTVGRDPAPALATAS